MQLFETEAESWKHAKDVHDGTYFPWVCAVCHRRFFVSSNTFILHWTSQHPTIEDARDVVHPTQGSHYSFLSVQRLNI